MRCMPLVLALAALAGTLSGCADTPAEDGTSDAAPLRVGSAPWGYTASRDLAVEGTDGSMCQALWFDVPASTQSLHVRGGASMLSGNGVTQPQGAGFVHVRLLAPDGQAVAMEPESSGMPADIQPPSYSATLSAPMPGRWTVEVEPNQVAVRQSARVIWELSGTGAEPDPADLRAHDGAC